MALLPPPPIGAKEGSYYWQDWYVKLYQFGSTAGVPWDAIDKTGSDLATLATRKHNDLQSIQGGIPGQYNHLTNAQLTALGNRAPITSPSFLVSVGFNGTTAITKPTVTGSRGSNAALASLLTALANYGLITDSST